MRKFKKFAAMVSAVALAACTVAPLASFAGVTTTTTKISNGSITIKTSEQDHKYTAYQIFDGNLAKVVTSDDSTTPPTENETITFSDVVWGTGLKKNATSGDPEIIEGEATVTIYDKLKECGVTITENGQPVNPFEKDGDSGKVALSNAEEVAEALKKLTDGEAATFTNIDKVAQVFAKFIDSSSSSNVECKDWSEDLDNDTPGNQSGYKMTISDPGYYLVIDEAKEATGLADGEAISKYILQVAGNTEVAPKADAPKVMKKVKEDTYNPNTTDKVAFTSSEANYELETGYNDAADYSIGEEIPFKLYGTLPSTFANYQGYYYQFNDTMGAGLDLVMQEGKPAPSTKDFVVTIKDRNTTRVLQNGSNANETAEFTFANVESPKGFTITIDDLKKIDMNSDQEGVQVMSKDAVITVEYKAKLNANAVIGNNGNPNEVSLKYSNDSNTAQGGDSDETGETPKDYNVVFTYELDVTKYLGDKSKTADNNEGTKAGFKLYKKVAFNGSETTKWAKFTDNKFTGWADSENDGTEVTTPSGGKMEFKGLQDGTYFLKETTTPTGYNTMDDLEVVINATSSAATTADGVTTPAENPTDIVLQTYKDTEDTGEGKVLKDLTIHYNDVNASSSDNNKGKVEAEIINKAGTALPGTGGIGTTIFYIGGGAMVAVAGVFLITKKRMNKKEN